MTPAREQWTTNGGGYAPQPNGGYAPQPEPRATATRRDTENMLADVARSETQSNDVYRRIEEQLRSVARRLESTERNQSENSRAMSKAASEINIAAREQAQSFDQLGGSVMSLADRLERVERSSATDGTRDAIKGLHQGLSRLAEQIAGTANQSASQISALATNLESLAGRLAQQRAETEANARSIDQRIAQIDTRVSQISQIDHQVAQIDQRLSHVSAIDDRLRSVERAAQSSNDALSHALSSIESRKDDEAAALRRDAETAGAIARLEDNFAKLEQRGTDPAIDRRLSGIERSLGDIVGRFDASPRDGIEDNIKRLAQRIETNEQRQRDQVAELRAAMNDSAARDPHALTGGPAAPFAQAFDPPPFAEMAPAEHGAFQVSADPFAPAFETAAGAPPFAADSPFGSGAFAADPFAAAPPPPVAAEPDTYLSAARRSARAAAAQADAERGSRMGGFSWGQAAADPAAKPEKAGSKKTYIWIAIIALMAIVAIAAGAILSQKISSNSNHTILFNAKPGTQATNVPPQVLPPVDGGETVPPAQTVAPANTTPHPTGVLPLQPRDVKPAPVHAVPGTAPTTPPKPTQALTPLDKLTQLANAGNAKAELVVGLKYLDGDGVAVSEADAAKWLERAAEQGLAVAQYRLGTLYERGRGVPTDLPKAVHWYQLAAQAGNRKAMHNLAVAYAGGAGTTKNLAEAARWFSKAAALGLSDSQFNLAVLYERGLGVPQSLLDAYKWYAIAAAGGDTESKSRIDALATQLSADDKAAAEHAAQAFRAQPLDPRSNVAPSMNDVAG